MVAFVDRLLPQAPDVHKVGSLYYLYYSVSTFGSQNSVIGLATSSTMDPGSWTDVRSVGVASTSAKPYNTIDPNLIQSWQQLLTSILDRSGAISTKSSLLLTQKVKTQTWLTTLNTILLGRAQAKDHTCYITVDITT